MTWLLSRVQYVVYASSLGVADLFHASGGMIPEVVGLPRGWRVPLLKRFQFMARQSGVVNRVEGRIPEVVGLRGVG